MLNYREFENMHDWRAVYAAPCRVRDSILFGEKIKANSWVIGVKVFADHIWQKVLSEEYQSFSIVGRGVRVPRVRFR